jgi:hypothetical protein
MKRRVGLVLLLLMTIGSREANATSPRTVGFVPQNNYWVLAPPPGINEFFEVQLRGQNFDSALESGTLNMTYDPALVEVISVKVDKTTWENFSTNGTIDNAAGKITGIGFDSLVGHTGNFPIATISFLATGTIGTSLLHIDSGEFATSNGQPVIVEDGTLVTIPEGAHVPGAPVAPTALVLLAAGIGLAHRRSRRAMF